MISYPSFFTITVSMLYCNETDLTMTQNRLRISSISLYIPLDKGIYNITSSIIYIFTYAINHSYIKST